MYREQVLIIKNDKNFIEGLIGDVLEELETEYRVRFTNLCETCFVPKVCTKKLSKDQI